MNTLTGSMVMSLTIIWPSVITFGSYDLSDDDDDSISSEEEEPSFFKKLTGAYTSLLHIKIYINFW